MLFKKTLVVSALVLVALFGTLAVLNWKNGSELKGMRLFSSDREIEEAFVQYIAKYGKAYATKSEVPIRFESFAKTYKMV